MAEPEVKPTTVGSERTNRLEETKLDAEFNFLERLRQDEAKKAHEEAKMKALKARQ